MIKKMYKVEVKYTRIAIPDVIYFSDQEQAHRFKISKEQNNPAVVWATMKKSVIKEIEEGTQYL